MKEKSNFDYFSIEIDCVSLEWCVNETKKKLQFFDIHSLHHNFQHIFFCVKRIEMAQEMKNKNKFKVT